MGPGPMGHDGPGYGDAPVPGYGGGPGGRGPGGPGGPPRKPFGRFRSGDDGEEGGDGEGGPRRRRLGGGASDSATAKSKKARRRNLIIAGLAVFIMLSGVGVVGGTYMVNSVPTPDELQFPETTTLYYNNGQELARLGEVTRFEVKYNDINEVVTEAIVASEDKTFWTNEGIDFSGVMRAAWNNFTGGEQQGGSTLTQQYARLAYDLKGASYTRKFNEAVLAWRLDDEYSKEQILEFYLNSAPLGRQTYGFEAAAQSFFGKSIKKTAKPEDQITMAQAMALVLMVKQPNPNPDDPEGEPGYDATLSPAAEKLSRERWDYVRGQMKELGYIKPEQDATLEYPPLEQWKKYNPDVGNGVEKPAGIIINHVLSELNRSEGQFKGMLWKDIREGGYKIYTTLHPGAQQAAENAANEKVAGSVMNKQPESLQSALVAVEPGTGRVLAYYGGSDGKGSDYAGIYFDDKGQAAGFGSHPPGSSFKVYTLAAGLKNGISLNSYWNTAPHDSPGRTAALRNQIKNSGYCAGQNRTNQGACTLLQSTIASLNNVFIDVALSVSPKAVLDVAKAAGIEYMWSPSCTKPDNPQGRVALTDIEDLSTVTPECFDYILAIGQYGVTVQDHANGIATMAAGGLRAEAHFVTKVMDGDRTVYSERLPTGNQERIMNQQALNDLTYALSQVGAAKISPSIGWDTAGKTGTWEYGNRVDQNSHAWMVGFDKKLAAAVWVGNKKEEKAIKDSKGNDIYGSGLPGLIWKSFMINATKAMNLKKENTRFNQPNFIGNTDPNGSIPSPTPPPPADPGLPPPPTSPSPGNGGITDRKSVV